MSGLFYFLGIEPIRFVLRLTYLKQLHVNYCLLLFRSPVNGNHYCSCLVAKMSLTNKGRCSDAVNNYEILVLRDGHCKEISSGIFFCCEILFTLEPLLSCSYKMDYVFL